MYEEFYGLKTRCFSKTPDPAFLYMSRSHAEALARLQYAVEEREFALLTGEVGSGKTTLTRALIDSLEDSNRPVLITNPRLSPAQFLRALAKKLGVEKPKHYKADLVEQINACLCEFHEKGISPVVIIDEAQLIPGKDTFEEIRLLTNYQLDDMNLLSLLLVGQTELKDRLKRPAYKALRQRIGIAYHLPPLSEEETAIYVRHRLMVAGRDEKLFGEDAIGLMHSYSGGVPRLINTIATGALLTGFGAGEALVGAGIIEDVVKDLGFLD
jgi:type II secretory pathway predicted ATPase ExeA